MVRENLLASFNFYMDKFFSCDWGTSSFRLRLVSIPALEIIAEEKSVEGIAETFNLWKEQKETEEKRFDFYLSILKEKIKSVQQKAGTSIEDIPVIISGMVSSSIGMVDIPYKSLPVKVDGSDFIVKTINKTPGFPHDIFIISGLQTDQDVIRGEETQLCGSTEPGQDAVFIFPGTHSKHVLVKRNFVVAFKTYMTGEFFNLLAGKSILSSSVDNTASFDSIAQEAFGKGIEDAQTVNILHGSFLVRTNLLFNKYSKQENYYYLSGLLIGSELKELKTIGQGDIFLIGSEEQCSYYKQALRSLYPSKKVRLISVEEATIKGQYKIYSVNKR